MCAAALCCGFPPCKTQKFRRLNFGAPPLVLEKTWWFEENQQADLWAQPSPSASPTQKAFFLIFVTRENVVRFLGDGWRSARHSGEVYQHRLHSYQIMAVTSDTDIVRCAAKEKVELQLVFRAAVNFKEAAELPIIENRFCPVRSRKHPEIWLQGM